MKNTVAIILLLTAGSLYAQGKNVVKKTFKSGKSIAVEGYLVTYFSDNPTKKRLL